MPGLWDPGSIGSVFIFTVASAGGDGQFGILMLAGRLVGWDGPWHVRFGDVVLRDHSQYVDFARRLPGARAEQVTWSGQADLWIDTPERPAPAMVDMRNRRAGEHSRQVECAREIAIAAKTILYCQPWDGAFEIER